MFKGLYSAFQSSNKEKLNEDIIYMRKNEDVHSYFKDLFMTLNLPGIKFLSSKTITDETEHEKYIPKKNLRIEENRLDLIEANFQLTYAEETKKVTIYLFFPKFVNDFFFKINGNRFFAIYQITDKNFYSVRKGLCLKTLLMPLSIKFVDFAQLHKEPEMNFLKGSKVFRLEFFKTKANKDKLLKNVLLYFYIKFGFDKTLELLGINDKVVISEKPLKLSEDKYLHVKKSNTMFVYVSKDLFNTRDNLNLVATFLDSIHDVKKYINIHNDSYWKKKILTTTNAKLEKADKAIMSLERILDERTKKNLREIPDLNNVFDVLIYMIQDFTRLFNLDNVDIYNRRIRLVEYLIFPLLIKFSELSYRMLNSRNMDMNRLTTVFSNIGSMFIIKKLSTNELLRYSNAVNSLELFSAALKYSCRGPQSLGNSSGNTLLKFRALHESYIGNLSLNSSSAGDPGVTGTINPFCQNIENMFFERPE